MPLTFEQLGQVSYKRFKLKFINLWLKKKTRDMDLYYIQPL